MSAGDAVVAAEELKRCCAATYQLDIVSALLGECYHPGGLDLTRRLASVVGLEAGMRVAEMASGPGMTAMALAEEFGVRVTGLELGAESAARAEETARAKGLANRVSFVVADAESVPLADGSFDAVFCECAFCTFPDKALGAREMARVLVPGGRVGIADVVIEPGALPQELSGAAAWIACIGGALPASGYEAILGTAGLQVVAAEPHGGALVAMVDAVEARLLGLIVAGLPAVMAIEPRQVRELAQIARRAIAEGAVGYALFVAEKAELG
jgi:SAM-dependent methyltransferase